MYLDKKFATAEGAREVITTNQQMWPVFAAAVVIGISLPFAAEYSPVLFRGVMTKQWVTVNKSVARGLLKPANQSKLTRLLIETEKGFAETSPSSAPDALRVLQQAAAKVNLEIPPGTLQGGDLVLNSAGGEVTILKSTGEIIVQRGTDVLLRLIPR